MTGGLSGKVALVTGAASGIGRATVSAMLERGAQVVGLDRNAALLGELAAQHPGGVLRTVTADLERTEALEQLVADILADVSRIDLLVNVAGVSGAVALDSPVLAYDEADWDRVFAINLKAPWVLTKYAGRHMVERGGGGRIVYVSSSSAHRATHVSNAAYPSAKAGLSALARVAAGELGRYDINVNTVAPGLTDTPIVGGGRTPQELLAASRTGPMANLLGRPSTAHDVAATIAFLCEPASRQITGQTIHTSAGAVV